MPERALQSQLQQLRDQLHQTNTLSESDRVALHNLLQDIGERLGEGQSPQNQQPLLDSLNLAVERLEVAHPSVTATLRSIIQTLMNMGI